MYIPIGKSNQSEYYKRRVHRIIPPTVSIESKRGNKEMAG